MNWQEYIGVSWPLLASGLCLLRFSEVPVVLVSLSRCCFWWTWQCQTHFLSPFPAFNFLLFLPTHNPHIIFAHLVPYDNFSQIPMSLKRVIILTYTWSDQINLIFVTLWPAACRRECLESDASQYCVKSEMFQQHHQQRCNTFSTSRSSSSSCSIVI